MIWTDRIKGQGRINSSAASWPFRSPTKQLLPPAAPPPCSGAAQPEIADLGRYAQVGSVLPPYAVPYAYTPTVPTNALHAPPPHRSESWAAAPTA